MLSRLRKIVPRPLLNNYHLLVSYLAAIIYNQSEKKLKIIGVTGTDGKTTTVNLLYHLLKTASYNVGLISTVKAVVGDKEYDTGLHVTTPDPRQVRQYLQKMVRQGSTWVVIEVTSHALDQNRVAGIDFEYGVITNIAHEHLDYHKSFANYVKAKEKIIKKSKIVVLNKDDENFNYLQSKVKGKMITFGIDKKADLMAKNISLAPFGTRFSLNGEKTIIRTPLIGNFNVYNCLAALSVAKDLGLDEQTILKGLRTFPSLAGRMQRIEEGQNFTVIVDFAHTPQALEEAIKTLRLLTRRRLIVVFGAASERDVEKRPMMGKIAIKEADLVVLTSEDPRYEDPNKIMADIASGVVKNGGVLNTNFWMVADRGRAIAFAIQKLAQTGDVVAIFGKGHEKSMNIKGVEIPWSDQDVVSKSLKGRKLN